MIGVWEGDDGEIVHTWGLRHDGPYDPGIARYVEALDVEGVETFLSCEGGPGHAYPVPTIYFYAPDDTVAVAAVAELPVLELVRTGPWWRVTLSPDE